MLDVQSRLMVLDEALALVRRTTGLSLEAIFFGAYLLSIGVIWTGLRADRPASVSDRLGNGRARRGFLDAARDSSNRRQLLRGVLPPENAGVRDRSAGHRRRPPRPVVARRGPRWGRGARAHHDRTVVCRAHRCCPSHPRPAYAHGRTGGLCVRRRRRVVGPRHRPARVTARPDGRDLAARAGHQGITLRHDVAADRLGLQPGVPGAALGGPSSSARTAPGKRRGHGAGLGRHRTGGAVPAHPTLRRVRPVPVRAAADRAGLLARRSASDDLRRGRAGRRGGSGSNVEKLARRAGHCVWPRTAAHRVAGHVHHVRRAP